MPKIAKDISKCAKIALYISIGAFVLFGVIYYLFNSQRDTNFFYYMKNNLYYLGCIGLVICCGFFIKKNANRSFKYQDDWNRMFHKLNLAFVIFFISLFICLYGMMIQFFLELKIL